MSSLAHHTRIIGIRIHQSKFEFSLSLSLCVARGLNIRTHSDATPAMRAWPDLSRRYFIAGERQRGASLYRVLARTQEVRGRETGETTPKLIEVMVSTSSSVFDVCFSDELYLHISAAVIASGFTRWFCDFSFIGVISSSIFFSTLLLREEY